MKTTITVIAACLLSLFAVQAYACPVGQTAGGVNTVATPSSGQGYSNTNTGR